MAILKNLFCAFLILFLCVFLYTSACNELSNSNFDSQSICVYSRIPNLIQALRTTVPEYNFIEVSSDCNKNFRQCEIMVIDFNLLAPHLYNLPQLRWVHGTWAGVESITPYINRPLPYNITRFSGEYFGRMITEYVVAAIVNQERDTLRAFYHQRNKIWSKEGKIGNFRPISSLNVGILGTGNIGSWIGKCLRMFGATVLGYGRRPEVDLNSEKYNYMTSYFTQANLPELLKHSDYIVNTLPHTPETHGLLNENILENCKEKRSFLINVGRGSIINEADLINALNNTWLSGAALDVFNTEPLPSNSLLWTSPNVFITPHVAGVSKALPIAQQFRENLELYLSNRPISNNVKFGHLY